MTHQTSWIVFLISVLAKWWCKLLYGLAFISINFSCLFVLFKTILIGTSMLDWKKKKWLIAQNVMSGQCHVWYRQDHFYSSDECNECNSSFKWALFSSNCIDAITVRMCALHIQLLAYPGQPFAWSLLLCLRSSLYNWIWVISPPFLKWRLMQDLSSP